MTMKSQAQSVMTRIVMKSKFQCETQNDKQELKTLESFFKTAIHKILTGRHRSRHTAVTLFYET